jgi:diguanylate cyclase
MTQTLHTTTNFWLVGISILTSIIASYAAFNFAERVAKAKGSTRIGWYLCGAIAMGLGIWSMHYLGMLSVQLPIPVEYHVPTVILSLLFAIAASAVALVAVTDDKFGWIRQSIGSVLMGVGIGGMHYIGMHAMRCTAMHHYDLRVVLVSVLVAVVFSWVALKIAFSMRTTQGARESIRLAGAAAMGLGIAAMHYTAMAAVTFVDDGMRFSDENTVRISTIGIAAVTVTMGIVVFGALITTVLDRKIFRRLEELHEQLSEEKDRFEASAECSMNALFICTAIRDGDGEIVDFWLAYMNSKVDNVVKEPISHMLDTKMCETLPLVQSLGLFERYRQVVLTGEPMVYEFEHIGEDVSWKWIRVQAVKVRDGVAITASDITERKESEERIHHMATHDPLTGLLNRGLLVERLEQATQSASRYGRTMGVLLLDLDLFKGINDTLGHAAGDTVLMTVANRMKGVFRGSDSIVRYGGDEFVVVIPEVRRREDLIRCADKLVETFRAPILIGETPVAVTCSVGVAIYPDADMSPGNLLAKADLALYIAKSKGKNQCYVYSGEAMISKSERTKLAGAAR